MIGVIIVLITLIFALVYVKHQNSKKRKNDYFKNKGVAVLKSESPIVFFRKILTSNLPTLIESMYKSFENERLFGFYNIDVPVFYLRDPLLIKQLAIKDFEHFTDHKMFIDRKHDPFFGNTLFCLEGQTWRNMRSALSPAFTGNKMRLMFELVNHCGSQINKFLTEDCEINGPQTYNMKDIYSKMTSDIIATCAFGVRCDSLREPNNDFLKTGNKVIDFQNPWRIFKLVFSKLFPDWLAAKLFDLKLIDTKTESIFSEIILSTMKTRDEKHIFRPDMINMLMELKKGQLKATSEVEKNESIATADNHEEYTSGSHRVWSDDELIPQCFIFFLAGFDTSSTLLTFTAYELAVNQDIQTRLQVEIDEVNTELSGEALTYERLQNMPYLDMIIAECLRKWPPVAMTDRVCIRDYSYKGDDGLKFSIEKGGTIWIPIYAFHRDPKYFPEPDKFDPERFSQENKSKVDFNAYLPFGVGPRNCIGSRFALMSAKVILYYILLNFNLEVCAKTQVPLQLQNTMAGLVPQKVEIMLKPRNK